ncbi:globin [Fictibacillus aquaticus]|uniref:Globin n=1 Tax=Fictibacillus aquaticus TaxID=2021314 RepID=A0A235FDR6_9BACL|nr:globin [Fictibacillus aquaticus]OYD59057.1 globin [Fictibacillus aquaticus]
MNEKTAAPYEHLGGLQGIEKLVTVFYSYVSKDPLLSPLFPDDLTETARKQTQFLSQFFGGPPFYTEEHGHPMLRARHMPFPITKKHAAAWLDCMKRALNTRNVPLPLQEFILSRLTMTAYHMVNTADNNAGKEQDNDMV